MINAESISKLAYRKKPCTKGHIAEEIELIECVCGVEQWLYQSWNVLHATEIMLAITFRENCSIYHKNDYDEDIGTKHEEEKNHDNK